VFDPLVTKTAKRGFYVVDLFRAAWNPSMATLSTDLPKYAQTGRRASAHIVRKSMDRPRRRLGPSRTLARTWQAGDLDDDP
jgi:hypothetical protein